MYRLGTTSYILPADLVTNARYLANKVEDMELVLFDLENGTTNIPTPDEVAQLAAMAADTGMTYTVHLPLDIRGGDPHDPSLVLAQKIIAVTQPLTPYAYILHLDGRALLELDDNASPLQVRQWQEEMVVALEEIAKWVGDYERIAVENVENYPPDFVHQVVSRLPVSRCVDVGHLWRDGHDPLPWLERALPNCRVIHLHGVGERDHQSLSVTPPEQLRPVLELLRHRNYTGVLTLEIFGEEDFTSSLARLQELVQG